MGEREVEQLLLLMSCFLPQKHNTQQHDYDQSRFHIDQEQALLLRVGRSVTRGMHSMADVDVEACNPSES